MLQKQPSTTDENSSAPPAEDSRESQFSQFLNRTGKSTGNRSQRQKALAEFIANHRTFARKTLKKDPSLRAQFFLALTDCDCFPFKALMEFIAKTPFLAHDFKDLLNDIMDNNTKGRHDEHWSTIPLRATLAKYVYHSDIIAHALLRYSTLPDTDPKFVARVLMNKKGAPSIYFKQIDSSEWLFVNFLKGLLEVLLPSFLYSPKLPAIPSDVLSFIEEAPRNLGSANAVESDNLPRISIEFNQFGCTDPQSVKGPSEFIKQLTAEGEKWLHQSQHYANSTFYRSPDSKAPDSQPFDETLLLDDVLQTPIKSKGNGSQSLDSDDEHNQFEKFN